MRSRWLPVSSRLKGGARWSSRSRPGSGPGRPARTRPHVPAPDEGSASQFRVDRSRLLTTISGIGLLSATALVAAIGSDQTFSAIGFGNIAGLGAPADDDGRYAEAVGDEQALQRVYA